MSELLKSRFPVFRIIAGIALLFGIIPYGYAQICKEGYDKLGFSKVHSHRLDRKMVHAHGGAAAAKKVIDFAKLDPKIWSRIIPEYVYSNAVVRKGTPFVRSLKAHGYGKQRFRHGTTEKAIEGIAKEGPWLTSGWGEVEAGFFLDMNAGISKTYQDRAGKLIEISLDKNAKTFVWDEPLQVEFLKWLKDRKNWPMIKKLHPEFFKLAKGRPDLVSRDNLARSFGAQVLINMTPYGQVLLPEAVVLDPVVVKGYRILE